MELLGSLWVKTEVSGFILILALLALMRLRGRSFQDISADVSGFRSFGLGCGFQVFPNPLWSGFYIQILNPETLIDLRRPAAVPSHRLHSSSFLWFIYRTL